MPTLYDPYLGTVTVHRSRLAKGVKVRVAPNGLLRVSAPLGTPLFIIKRVLSGSRQELLSLLANNRELLSYNHGDTIGKSHTLMIRHGKTISIHREGLQLTLTKPDNVAVADAAVQEALRPAVIAAFRREAKGYLPKRLQYLASQHGFSYQRVRFSHAGGRWGSCSSTGTISLNIALMKLPFELIDYVLIHELSHTKHMNHSDDFWRLVSQYDPSYLRHRRLLGKESPSI